MHKTSDYRLFPVQDIRYINYQKESGKLRRLEPYKTKLYPSLRASCLAAYARKKR